MHRITCKQTLILASALWMTTLIATVSPATEPVRIWVDSTGMFSIEARLIQIDDERVVLLRDDGNQIKIAREKLSERDKQYLDGLQTRDDAALNPLRSKPPEPPESNPLPPLDLPPATASAEDGTRLSLGSSGRFNHESATKLPRAVAPDPSPWTFQTAPTRISIDDVDVYDIVSRPLPLITIDAAGQPKKSVAMSISSGLRIPGSRSRNQVVRFDLSDSEAYVVMNHDEPIRLLDHHDASGRSLMLVGFDPIGKGGELAIVTGWDQGNLQLSHRRALGDESNRVARVPKLRWARWVDDEHVIALVDKTLVLWNLVSGDQVYSIQGIDHRALPAISGGRRYVALPYEGSVQLIESATGRSLGRIGVEKQVVPGVSFSHLGHALAIVTTRRIRNWDLSTASLSADIVCRRTLGTDPPIWVNSDLVLSSSGVLLSAFRGIPVWRYDLAAAETTTIGDHLAVFRSHPVTELTVLSLPHEAAVDAIYWIDNSPTKIDTDAWRVPGRSLWKTQGWDDRDVRISAAKGRMR